MATAGAAVVSATLSSIGATIFSDDVSKQITFLRQNGLLATQMDCNTCNVYMNIGAKADINDGEIFRLA